MAKLAAILAVIDLLEALGLLDTQQTILAVELL